MSLLRCSCRIRPFGMDKPLLKYFPGIPIDQKSATWMRFNGGAQTRRRAPRIVL